MNKTNGGQRSMPTMRRVIVNNNWLLACFTK